VCHWQGLYFFPLAVWRFELKASHLLGRHSTTCASPSAWQDILKNSKIERKLHWSVGRKNYQNTYGNMSTVLEVILGMLDSWGKDPWSRFFGNHQSHYLRKSIQNTGQPGFFPSTASHKKATAQHFPLT
jgi:hypothetical protein